MPKLSIFEKSEQYLNALKENPSVSNNELGRRFKGTEFGMRAQARNQMMKELRAGLEFLKELDNSDMTRRTKKKMSEVIRGTASSATDLQRDKERKAGKEIPKEKPTIKKLREKTYHRGTARPQHRDKFYFYR